MNRFATIIIGSFFLVGLVFAYLNFTRLGVRDGSPDDRLITAMDYVAWDAQTAIDETGDLPMSLSGLAKLLNRPDTTVEDIGITYSRLDSQTIQLCGEFGSSSTGQPVAQPYSDFTVELRPELTVPRPKEGLHCYDIELERSAPSERNDALTYRGLNAAATAIECSYWATHKLPNSLETAKELSIQQRDNPACRHVKEFLGKSSQPIDYSRVGEATIELCAEFENSFSSSSERLRVFDPRYDSRFFELTQVRPKSGEFCYVIEMLQPDPKLGFKKSAWIESVQDKKIRSASPKVFKKDKRAIGEVVNVLRLARCAYTMGGTVSENVDEAIQIIASNPKIAQRYSCGWASSYFGDSSNYPVAKYSQTDRNEVTVCAEFESEWANPLGLNFYPEAANKWPTNLPELQRSITEAGLQCYTAELTPIGSGL